MKQIKIISLIASICFSLNINGYGQISIKLRTTSGVIQYASNVIKTITFDPGVINFNTNTGNQSFSMSNIVNITFDYSPVSIVKTDEEFENSFFIYPNPVPIDQMNVTLNLNRTQNVFLAVFNLQGQQVTEENQMIKKGKSTLQIDLNDLKPGVYLLNVHYEGFLQSVKFIKI